MLSRRFSLRPTLSSCQRRFALQANAAQADTRRVSIMVGFIECAFLALPREIHYQIVGEADLRPSRLGGVQNRQRLRRRPYPQGRGSRATRVKGAARTRRKRLASTGAHHASVESIRATPNV